MERSPEFSGTRMNSTINADKNRSKFSNKTHLIYKILLNHNSRCIGIGDISVPFSLHGKKV